MSHRYNRDWKCICGEENFSSRDKCRKCDLFRSKALKASFASNSKLGDWKCRCGENNFAKRDRCYKCSSAKGTSSTDIRPGDWSCTSCNEQNWGTREVCHKCGTIKDRQILPENDNCVICMSNKANIAIKLCGHLSTCDICALKIDKCPMCRIEFNSINDVIRVYIA